MAIVKERRLSLRYRLKIEVEITVKSIGSARPYSFRTGNISSGGVFLICDTANPFSLQSILEVTVYLPAFEDRPEGTVQFMGKVAHMQDKSGFGLKISQIDPGEQKKLDDFIEEYGKLNPESKIPPKFF